MKHPSRWPYILRLPACVAVVCLVWWTPLVLTFLALHRWGWPPEFTPGERTALTILGVLGWSFFIQRTLIFRVIEPYFNCKSLQNPWPHLFRPEPHSFRSFRDWWRWTFLGEQPASADARGTEEPP